MPQITCIKVSSLDPKPETLSKKPKAGSGSCSLLIVATTSSPHIKTSETLNPFPEIVKEIMGRFCFYKLLLVSVLLLLSLPHGSTGNCHNFFITLRNLFSLLIYFFWALNHHFLLICQLSGFSRQLKESAEFEDSTVHVQVGFLYFGFFRFSFIISSICFPFFLCKFLIT